MKLKFKSSLFAYAFLFLPLLSLGQTNIYEAYIKSHKVGEMKVVKEINDEGIKINVDTHIEAHMLMTITVDFKSRSTHMNNMLIDASAESRANGHLKNSVQTHFSNGKYQINLDGKEKTLAQSDLLGADLYYFEVPKNGQKLYSLATGEMITVQKESDSKYYFVHDGKKESHLFDEHGLKELTINHRLYTVIFKRRD